MGGRGDGPRSTVNYSEALLSLVRAGGLPAIDGVEVGPWFTPREIEAYLASGLA